MYAGPVPPGTDQLCRRWRCSYLRLDNATDLPARTLLVQKRQRYLDELERRDPAAFARWLADGARAAGDPSQYMSP